MARTLTRPMFRKGGMAQREEYMGGGITTPRIKRMGGGMTGIMSGIVPDGGLTPRVGYANGPSLEQIIAREKLQDPSTTIYDKDYIQKQLDKKTRKFYDPGLSGYGQQMSTPDTPTQRAIKKYLEEDPEEAYEAFKKGKIPGFGETDYGALQATQATQAKEAGIDLGLGDTSTSKITNNTGTGTSTSTGADTQSEFRRVFGEYLPVIEEQFKTDDDAAVRDRYLALAKFGAGLAAQPGGDLVGAIGKAAQKPLDDLSVIAAQQRKEKQTPKMLALQATLDTLKQDGKSSVDKQIDFQKISKEAEGISKTGEVGYGEALMIAEAKVAMGKEGGKYNSLYPDKKEKVDKIIGPKYFYTKDGTLKIVKNGDTFTPEEWKNSPLNKQ